MMIMPSIILVVSPFLRASWVKNILLWYTIIILNIVSVIEVIDLEIYSYWGEKFDALHLLYLTDPSQLTNSLSFWRTFIPIIFMMSFIYINVKVSKKIIAKFTFDFSIHYYWQKPILFLALGGLSLIPIRGGFSIFPWRLGVPINVGAVYFNHHLAVNHAAVNTLWNFLFSISEWKDLDARFDLMPDQQATSLFEEFNGASNTSSKTTSLLKTKRPNVILIIVESLTAKAIEVLGGEKGVTPHFNKLSREGVLFSNFYASGHRSNRGIGSIFSSYPGLPYTAIILHPNKVEQLPHLMGSFRDNGYNTAFYYGGEIDFANFRAYFQQGKASNIISKLDFPFSTMTTKWGVHDHVVFDTLFNDINCVKEPFFYSFFTLSSHEPFDIPTEKRFGDNNSTENFKSAVHYTDACLGKFIDKAKKTDWWNNTLVVITADHGVKHIKETANGQKETFQIPMLWLGGALSKKDTLISSLSCHLDLAPTILSQVNIDHSQYIYGKNILTPSYSPRAFYSYGDGVGLLTDSSYQIYNYEINSSAVVGVFDTTRDYGKATFQYFANDFHSK